MNFRLTMMRVRSHLFDQIGTSLLLMMPNLNYDVPQDVPQDLMDVQIIKLIRNDKKISTEKIADVLGVSTKTVKRHIKKMNNVRDVGSGYSGYWEIKVEK